MKKHILFYSDNPQVGGVPQYNYSVLRHLAKARYRVTSVQNSYSSEEVARQKALGIEHLWLDFDTFTNLSRTLKDINTPQNIFSRLKPDLILFSDGWVMGNFAAKQAALALSIPYLIVVGIVDADYRNFSYNDGVPYVELMRHHYSQAKTVITVSEENLKVLHHSFQLPKQIGEAIYYGRPAEYFNPTDLSVRQRLRHELNIPVNAVVCLTIGRMTSTKGYEYQLKAIEQLKQTRDLSNLYFIWVGGGGKSDDLRPHLETVVQQVGVSDRIKFLANRNDIPNLLDASDIFILSTKVEGMPLAIMEAMAKGLPVIASAVSGIPEELGNTGKLLPDPNLYPEQTIRELAETMSAWTADARLRQQQGTRCKERAETLFTEHRMLEDTLNAIQRVETRHVETRHGVPSSSQPKVSRDATCRDATCRVSTVGNVSDIPKVSVCLPTYNGAEFIREAIDSILAQTFKNFELIICDDASTDETPQIVDSYLDRDKRIRYFQNSQRLGLFANWNKCLEYSVGDYLTVFAQDDVMLPTNLAKKVKILESHPTVGLVASSAIVIDQDGRAIASNWAHYSRDEWVRGKDWLLANAGTYNPICCPFVFFTRQTLEKVGGGFNDRYLFSGDYEMWQRMALVTDFYFMEETLGYYRNHESSTTQTETEIDKVKEQIQVWSETLDRLDLSEPELAKLESEAFSRIVRWFLYDEMVMKYIDRGQLDAALELCHAIENWRGKDAKLSLIVEKFGSEILQLQSKVKQLELQRQAWMKTARQAQIELNRHC